MNNVIVELIRAGGPLFGPLLFAVAFGMTWLYHGLLRQVSIRQNRFALFLLDKKVGTLDELYRYGLLQEITSAVDEFALIRKGAL